LVSGLKPEQAASLLAELKSAGAEVQDEELKTYNWPLPYDELINPLAINLTAANTFILICSSVTMVLALAAIQDGNKVKGRRYLLATVLIGSCFLSVQVYEYYQLMFGHHYPPGISATGHFRPSVSLFASCFFTMTGFHGAHVTGGVILLAVIYIRARFFNAYSSTSYAPVELAGLYWHFVDLVWIILFTIVYLL
jgi:heme/copper-type cytochrome/quinol oxidase subunit 3